MKQSMLFFFLAFALVLASSFALAESHLPEGLLRAEEYNDELAAEFLAQASIFIAFIAGLTSIFSPCILPLLPPYFAITFKERKRRTLSTFFFFIGFTAAFITMGLLATLTGKALSMVFSSIYWLVPVAGAILIGFGLMILLGKGFPGLKVKHKPSKSAPGLILAGVLFAIGWTACIGPLLSGVLLMTASFANYTSAAILMLSYSLGIFVPLFLLSYFYDRIGFLQAAWLYRPIHFSLFGKRMTSTWPNVISGLLFIFLGIVFIIYRGTASVNGLQMFGLREYFYSLQDLFIENAAFYNWVGAGAFTVFVVFLVYVLIKEYWGK